MIKIQVVDEVTIDTTPKELPINTLHLGYTDSPCELGSSVSAGPNKPPLPPC